ncbi:MAG: TIGR00159 family protein [Planctomycetes bacterium RBG_16_59_8]|nr:MAG: TIGR00159 family protein [Planctomycetes bacterium RBG_16_59_8]
MWDELFNLTSLVEIAALYVLCYAILKFVKGTRGAALLKAMIFIVVIAAIVVLFLADSLKLHHLKQMIEILLSGLFIAIIVLFAPEIRRGLVRLAQSPILSPLLTQSSTRMIEEVGKMAETLARRRVGALIAIEREVGLSEYAESGVKLDADVTCEILEAIFYPGTPTHDGAVIISHDRIAAVRCLLPLTEDPGLPGSLGTRHRAAIGVTEETDAIAVVVSEETGTISLCVGGELTGELDRPKLVTLLGELYNNKKGLIRTERLGGARP